MRNDLIVYELERDADREVLVSSLLIHDAAVALRNLLNRIGAEEELTFSIAVSAVQQGSLRIGYLAQAWRSKQVREDVAFIANIGATTALVFGALAYIGTKLGFIETTPQTTRASSGYEQFGNPLRYRQDLQRDFLILCASGEVDRRTLMFPDGPTCTLIPPSGDIDLPSPGRGWSPRRLGGSNGLTLGGTAFDALVNGKVYRLRAAHLKETGSTREVLFAHSVYDEMRKGQQVDVENTVLAPLNGLRLVPLEHVPPSEAVRLNRIVGIILPRDHYVAIDIPRETT